MKVAFLDRDGTINRSCWQNAMPGSDAEYWVGSETPELLPGALEGMRYLKSRGYEIIIITNQYPIGEGTSSQAFYDRYTERLLSMLRGAGAEVLDVFYCPHRRDEGCSCIKPQPGMILKALEKYPSIEMDKSFFAGDSAADEGIAAACGLPFYGVKRGGERRIESLAGLIGLV